MNSPHRSDAHFFNSSSARTGLRPLRYMWLMILPALLLINACQAPLDQTRGGEDQGTFAIRLKSRVFEPKPGLDPALDQYFLAPARERVHVIVQFNEIPDLQARRQLSERYGVRILDTIPEGAYFASIPSDMGHAKELLGTGTVRWIGPIELLDRVAPALHQGKAPAYTMRDGDLVELAVLFFGDIEEERQLSTLGDIQVEVVDRLAAINGWLVLAKEDRILELAKIDDVKWVEEGPPAPELDNDGARSATATNVDAVNPPAPYNLSGQNVVVMHREIDNASLTHGDLSANIILADPPLPLKSRSHRHIDAAPGNAQYDAGETVYVDMDDDTVVSLNDWRATVNGALTAATAVVPGDADIGTATLFFQSLERFDDADFDRAYTNGETIYVDNDGNPNFSTGGVTVGDNRVTASGCCAAGTVVALGDTDIGTLIRSFPTDPHSHPTHVAGTVISSGGLSVANGGSANQWKGMAPAATLRSYRTDNLGPDYVDAANASAALSTNSWGSSHHHQQIPPSPGYSFTTGYYDSVISGRQSDGSASGLALQMTILGSSGNRGAAERHTESVAANGQFDNGEAIIRDNDDSGTVSPGDAVLIGAAPAIGTNLVNFALNERHNESVNTAGTINNGEAIYLDADNSWTVSAGDTRINGFGAFAANTIVAAPDADSGTFLRQFRMWGNVRIPNAAKDTIVVANLRSDTAVPSPISSRGPTLDGRVKPDISGPGSEAANDFAITSTEPRNTYGPKTGTSMSTPAVAGTATLLTEWYRLASLAAGPRPSDIRGLLIHSAEDLTTIPTVGAGFAGPDFAFGYGRVRVDQALSLVPHHLRGTVNAPGDTDHTFTIGSVANLKATLTWDDPAWTANAAPSAITGMLQNDLDLTLIAPDGTQYTPWLLNPAQPNAAATNATIAAATPIPAAARDRLNTVEQVEVAIAQAGTWTARVTGSTLSLGPQPYTLVADFIAPQDSPSTGLAATDVFVRDNIADTGAVPSSGTLYLSPDLWNRYLADGVAGHQDPEFGQENYLYATIRNLSATDITRATTVDVWIAQAATGLAWPDNFTFVGRFPVANLTAGEVRTVGPLAWMPPAPAPSDHFCFYIRATSPQDPITFAEGASVSNNTRNSNNIAWRNVNIVDLASDRTVAFQVRNIAKERARIDLVIEIPEAFLEIGRAFVQLPPAFERALIERRESVRGVAKAAHVRVHPWETRELDRVGDEELILREPKPRQQIRYQLTGPRIHIPGPVMAPGEAATMRLTFGSDQREKASYDIHVMQRDGEEIVGGILYTVRTGHIAQTGDR